jgi:LacI family transcriptional regulator
MGPRISSPAPREVTIKEVAARANVSVATVSRVVNNKGPVARETWQRVIDACQALRYVPHGAARSLSIRRTNTVEVLLPDLYGEFFSEVIRGIDLAARRRGYHLLVSGSHSDWGEMAAVLQAVRGRVDGLIVMSPDLEARSLRAHLPAGVPVVLLNCADDSGGYSITIDNFGGAQAMVGHLLSAGSKKIAFIAGPERNVDAAERLRGFREALASMPGATAHEVPGDFSEEAGYSAVREILALRERPDAVFAANDSMAIGALCALQEAGLRVPADIAVVGFDDIPIARFVSPPLTTVNVSISELGRRAFDLLLEAVENPSASGRIEAVPTRLVVRESCGAALPHPDENQETRLRAAEQPASASEKEEESS